MPEDHLSRVLSAMRDICNRYPVVIRMVDADTLKLRTTEEQIQVDKERSCIMKNRATNK